MTPTERSLRLSAAMSEREMRMYRALEQAVVVTTATAKGISQTMPQTASTILDEAAPIRALLAAIDAEILSTHARVRRIGEVIRSLPRGAVTDEHLAAIEAAARQCPAIAARLGDKP